MLGGKCLQNSSKMTSKTALVCGHTLALVEFSRAPLGQPLLAVARFFEDLFSSTFAGHPQERFWTPKLNKRVPKKAKMDPERVPK
jgi:hypothetical protein